MENTEKRVTFGTQDTRRRQRKQKHNIICVGHHYTQEKKTKTKQKNANNVNKTRAFLQTTGS